MSPNWLQLERKDASRVYRCFRGCLFRKVGSHKSTLAAVRTIRRVDGVRGFYAGYAPTLARDVPFDALQFMLYEFMKRALAGARGESAACAARRHALL